MSKGAIGQRYPGIAGMREDEYPLKEYRAECPECGRMTKADPEFEDQTCEYCGAEFDDESVSA